MDRTLGKAQVAWPALVAVQLAGLLSLGLVTRAEVPERAPPDVENALLSLDVPRAEVAVEHARANYDALGARIVDAGRVREVLSPVVERSGFVIADAHLLPRLEDSSASVAVERAVLSLEGETFRVPELLHDLEQSELLMTPTALRAVAGIGADGKRRTALVLMLDCFSPRRFDVSWVPARLSSALPGADHAVPVLAGAADLVALRWISEATPELQALSTRRYESLRTTLPKQLIRLRKEGGELTWSFGPGR